MKRLVRIAAIALPLIAVAAVTVRADVKERDRSSAKFEGMLGRMVSFFGGKGAKEGIEGTTAVKGDRKATFSETTGRIVDLSEEKVYDLDMKKKTYTVTTFDEIRRRMREAEEKAQKDAQKEEPAQAQEAQQQQKPTKEYTVDWDVKETGQKKQVAGYDTHETIVTITVHEKGRDLEDSGGMVMTNDIWLGPKLPQMKEFADFELRYWKQLQGPDAVSVSPEQMAAALAMYPMMKSAMERMSKDGDKLAGTPLDTTSTFEAVKSKDAMAQQQQQQPQPATATGFGGMLAKKMMKKNDEPKQRATVMTLHHEVLEVATSVSASDLAIPPDFKEKK